MAGEQVPETRVGERQMNHTTWHDAWPQLKAVVNWMAAALGMGSALGAVNLAVGVLSACWLAIQCYNWFFYTRPRNQLELEELRTRVNEAAALRSERPDGRMVTPQPTK